LNGKHALPIALVWCILVSGSQFAQARPKTIVFAHVNVVPMDGNRILTDQDVTVIDDKIASIQPADNSVLSKDVQVIGATGKFLMPGLGEMHAHLPEPSGPPEYMRTSLALYVTNGVTTVAACADFRITSLQSGK
jgi:imidazolonepropionase-like amidohydrolase